MKLKGLTKLVLAGTALAATAATLTTSTYAWYVVNTTVKAEGLSGATAGTNIGGSVLISYADSDTLRPVEYTTKLDFTTDNKVSDSELLPITKASEAGYVKTADTAIDDDKTYYTYNNSTKKYDAVSGPVVGDIANYFELAYEAGAWVDRDGKIVDVEASGTKGQSGYTPGKVVTYKFWLKASESTNVTVSTKFTNTTAPVAPATVLKQTFYSEAGLPTGFNKSENFAVDAVYALRMEAIETQYDISEDTYVVIANEEGYNAALAAETAYTKSGSTYTKVAAATAYDANTTYYNKTASATMAIKKDAQDKDLTKSTIVGAVENNAITYVRNPLFDDHTGGDANKYYYSIMKTAGYGTDATQNGKSPDELATTWTTVSLVKDVDTLITLNIWLEGTDAQCWDSCVGQTFKIDVQFDA